MSRRTGSELSARWMVVIWVVASAIAASFVWYLLQKNPDQIVLPENFATTVAHNDVLIGSSLSLSALPNDDSYANILSPDRATYVASAASITEGHTISILEAAVAADVNTVLLEVNAFSHEFTGLWNIPVAATLAGLMADYGKRMTKGARATAGLPTRNFTHVRLNRLNKNHQQFAVAGRPDPQLYPRALADPARLNQALLDARRKKTRVLLFWPPLPEGGFGRDPVRYASMQEHVVAFAEAYQLPLWTAASPWPDSLFLDNYGHLNAKGRMRFAAEIGVWTSSQ